MATSKAGRKGLDEQPLEGGGSGGGRVIILYTKSFNLLKKRTSSLSSNT